VRLLRRVLFWQAALWATFGLAIALAPGLILEDVFDQAPMGDTAWARLAGIGAFCLALNMVVVAQKIEDVWWFAWTFVILEAGTLAISLTNALGAAPERSSVVLWWLLTALGFGFLGLLVAGLAKAGTERPAT
jgi:hypothetical protein